MFKKNSFFLCFLSATIGFSALHGAHLQPQSIMKRLRTFAADTCGITYFAPGGIPSNTPYSEFQRTLDCSLPASTTKKIQLISGFTTGAVFFGLSMGSSYLLSVIEKKKKGRKEALEKEAAKNKTEDPNDNEAEETPEQDNNNKNIPFENMVFDSIRHLTQNCAFLAVIYSLLGMYKKEFSLENPGKWGHLARSSAGLYFIASLVHKRYYSATLPDYRHIIGKQIDALWKKIIPANYANDLPMWMLKKIFYMGVSVYLAKLYMPMPHHIDTATMQAIERKLSDFYIDYLSKDAELKKRYTTVRTMSNQIDADSKDKKNPYKICKAGCRLSCNCRSKAIDLLSFVKLKSSDVEKPAGYTLKSNTKKVYKCQVCQQTPSHLLQSTATLCPLYACASCVVGKKVKEKF